VVVRIVKIQPHTPRTVRQLTHSLCLPWTRKHLLNALAEIIWAIRNVWEALSGLVVSVGQHLFFTNESPNSSVDVVLSDRTT
jgi:hypothetical protein